ncbi:hypothetical protein AVEN_258652-1 [Araneus ventricosus]|uniref:MADF domain-containing protein n=1 Tax=Araneus ventricosus TaxID=182803 RepID=A0A4Y2JKD5_ARAVE|nr:hypothetical protein AVEN_258652-1 [Araneus ventricosus]
MMEDYLDSERIIQEVEKYPNLYDTRVNEFPNRELKKLAWMAVTRSVVGEKWDQMDEITRSDVVPSVNLPLQDNGEDVSSRSDRKRSILQETKIRLKCLKLKPAGVTSPKLSRIRPVMWGG